MSFSQCGSKYFWKGAPVPSESVTVTPAKNGEGNKLRMEFGNVLYTRTTDSKGRMVQEHTVEVAPANTQAQKSHALSLR